MKKIYPLLLILATFYSAAGQTGTLTGVVLEASTRLPMEFATVLLYRISDTNAVGAAITDPLGAFALKGITPGSYYLNVGFLGFENVRTAEFIITAGGTTDAGAIALKPSDILLKEATVVDEKPVFVQSIDRKIYYPEKDLQSQSSSVSELLENVPSVSVDADGVVSLRGSTNVTFLINGRPSGLMNRNSATYLQQMPANSIERIEIITNPSAKYRPDGTAGIINIVLKKNAKEGFNTMLLANASTHDRYNGSLSLNFKPGKINLFSSYSYRRNWYPREGADFRTVTAPDSGEQTTFDLRQTAEGRPQSHMVNAGLDYHFNEHNIIGFTGAWFAHRQQRSGEVTTVQRNSSGVVQDYITRRDESETEYETELSASFEHRFPKEDHTLTLETGYSDYSEREESRYVDTYFTPDYPGLNGRNVLKKGGRTTSVVAEYANPFAEDMELEAGYEGEFFTDDLDYASERFDPGLSEWSPEPEKTNRFLFRQDVHALFGTVSAEFDDLSVQLGLRAEQTLITSRLLTTGSVIPNHYFKLFPTLHTGWNLSEAAQIGLSYSRRVNRPDSDEMNPFPEYKDPRDIEAGNPNLKPEQIHSLELGLQWKKNDISFIPSLYYRFEYDAFAEITSYINDTTLLTTFDNLARNQAAGLELVFSWNLKSKMNVNLSSNTFWNTIDASNLGYSAGRSAFSTQLRLNLNLNLTPNTALQANTSYRSAYLTAQGKSLPYYYMNAGLRQDIFKKKAALLLSVSDVFNTRRWTWEIDTPELQQKVTRKRKSQIVYLGFSWRFGAPAKKSEDGEMIFEDAF